MPSKSYIDFLELLEDVNQLINTHFQMTKGKAGRKKLGYLTRSAVVMLCAAWERYNENLLLETIDKILTSNIKAKDLPNEVKKYVSGRVKKDKNEIFPIELADDGWKNLWKGYAINDTDNLHTPNSQKLNLLFKRNLGIIDFTTLWLPHTKKKINEFVSDRGEIAHNGSKAKYIRMNSLKKYKDLTIDNAANIDFNISQLLQTNYGVNSWVETYHRSIDQY